MDSYYRYKRNESIIFELLEIFPVNPKTGERRFKKAYRIIDSTPILNENRAGADIIVYHKNRHSKFSKPIENVVYFYFTSQEESPGVIFDNWKDGKPLVIALNNDTKLEYNIQPERYEFLEQTGNCQQESYYGCIALQFDTIEFDIDTTEFKECSRICNNDLYNITSKKCMPNIFSNLGTV